MTISKEKVLSLIIANQSSESTANTFMNLFNMRVKFDDCQESTLTRIYNILDDVYLNTCAELFDPKMMAFAQELHEYKEAF
jgi:hypothetical protein